jgi:SAM-dependent methyltransferase
MTYDRLSAVTDQVRIEDVQRFWDENPLASAAIPHPLGSPEYFEHYDGLREQNESVEFSYSFHEYRAFGGKKVLDVGCGNGYVLSRYAREGADVSGVDITPTGVELTRKRFELMGLEGDFWVASAEDLPFADASFDCVSSTGVIHHTPSTENAIEEIYRVLKPGGRLILMVYHRNSAMYRINFPLQRLLSRKSTQQLVNEVDGVGNPKGDVFSRAQFKRLVHRFDDVELFVDLLQPWMIAPHAERLIPARVVKPFASRFGWFLYAKAYKPTA